MKTLAIVIGTARRERQSAFVAQALATYAQEHGIETVLIDVSEARWVATEESLAPEVVTAHRELLAKSTAIALVMPEYNHGYPGELKLMLDSTDGEVFEGKRMGVCGVSPGDFGGARGAENILPVLLELHTIPVLPMYVRRVEEAFADGILQASARADFEKRAQSFLERLQLL